MVGMMRIFMVHMGIRCTIPCPFTYRIMQIRVWASMRMRMLQARGVVRRGRVERARALEHVLVVLGRQGALQVVADMVEPMVDAGLVVVVTEEGVMEEDVVGAVGKLLILAPRARIGADWSSGGD
jgi:hypothetical protein